MPEQPDTSPADTAPDDDGFLAHLRSLNVQIGPVYPAARSRSPRQRRRIERKSARFIRDLTRRTP